MGTWGHGSFANDSAMDWLDELADKGPAFLGETFDVVNAAEDGAYLEFDESTAGLAAAEVVAAALGHGDDRLDEDALAWLEEHREAARAVGVERARRAVERIYVQSELRELWDESAEDTEWHADVRELLKRLAA
jgi:hypothetical protein